MLLVLMLVAVALPAVSFFAMHARMLDRQKSSAEAGQMSAAAAAVETRQGSKFFDKDLP